MKQLFDHPVGVFFALQIAVERGDKRCRQGADMIPVKRFHIAVDGMDGLGLLEVVDRYPENAQSDGEEHHKQERIDQHAQNKIAG